MSGKALLWHRVRLVATFPMAFVLILYVAVVDLLDAYVEDWSPR